MSNLPALPEANAIPSYMLALAEACPELVAASNDLLDGLSGGMPPSIGLKGTRFVLKEGGEDTIIDATNIKVVVLSARPGVSKSFYVNKYTPGQEPQSPDCSSFDGVKPDSASPLKQHATCAGCPNNVFGTATDNQGNATKGKACGDYKILAVLYNGGVYQLRVPPASLRNIQAYVKLLGGRNLWLPAVITQIGFDAKASFPVLNFDYAGSLSEAQCQAVVGKISSPEVAEIIAAPNQIAPARQKPAATTAAVVTQPEAEAVAINVTEAAPEEDTPFIMETPPPAEKKQAAPKQAAPKQAQAVAPTAGPTADQLAAELGLIM